MSIGTTVLLIDIERQKLGTRLDNLLARNTFTEKNGKRKIQIGSHCVDYHPAFRLYLYTNLPLDLITEETVSSLFTRCLVINMALSCEGLQEHLLAEVLAIERPDYESERRSLEADIYHHEQKIKIAEVRNKRIVLYHTLVCVICMHTVKILNTKSDKVPDDFGHDYSGNKYGQKEHIVSLLNNL